MATLPLYNPAGETAGQIELADGVFGVKPNVALMHQAVVATLANARQGTADTKTRSEVNRTTRKLFRQKGTGRARQGSRSAPHWKGGGVVFGPHPRDYTLALPKRMRRAALLSAISSRVTDGAVRVVEELGLSEPKTKLAVALLKALGLGDARKILLVLPEITDTASRAFGNLPNVMMTTSAGLGTYDTLNAEVLLFTRAGIETLQALKQQPLGSARWLAKQQGGAV
jgi:large subunit ribosomal protein L4